MIELPTVEAGQRLPRWSVGIWHDGPTPCWSTASLHSLYFFYLFLAGAAIAVLMSMRYLETEHENHGEFYA
jgi:hypothetical protein